MFTRFHIEFKRLEAQKYYWRNPRQKKKEIILPSGRPKLAPAAAGVIDKNNCELLEEVCVGGGATEWVRVQGWVVLLPFKAEGGLSHLYCC